MKKIVKTFVSNCLIARFKNMFGVKPFLMNITIVPNKFIYIYIYIYIFYTFWLKSSYQSKFSEMDQNKQNRRGDS